MITVKNLNDLDGVEVKPGITLIGQPSYHDESQQWHCLANCFGTLAVVELSVKVIPDTSESV